MRQIKNIVLAVLMSVSAARAQQVVMLNNSLYQPVMYNPAFAGAGNDLNILLLNRTQWTGFKGAPRYNLFSLDKSFDNNKMGAGINILSDRKGINDKLGGNLMYSCRINLNDQSFLAMGISAGLYNQSLSYSDAVTENAADATLYTGIQHKITYDGNAGLAFVSRKLQMGIAALQLSGNTVKYIDNGSASVFYTYARHYIGSLKYRIFLGTDQHVCLSPQAVVRFVPNAPFQYDGNLTLEWIDKFWVGATYKSGYAVAAHAGFCIHKQLYFGYAYDIAIGEIGAYAGQSHEIMVNLQLGKNKKPAAKPAEPPAETEIPDTTKPEKAEKKDTVKISLPAAKDTVKTPAPSEGFSHTEKKWDSLETKRAAQVKPEPPKEVVLPVQQTKPKAPEPPVNVPNKNSTNGIGMATNKASEFKDNSGHNPAAGYYVISGSFHTRDFALAEVKRLADKYPDVNWIYFQPTDFTCVYIYKVNSKSEAMKIALDAKESGISDVWIQRIIE